MFSNSSALCQRHKGYINRTARSSSVARVHWAGASFSNHSCLVVFRQRAPGSHSTGLLSVSSSPPALELLLPAHVYSALLSKLHLCKLTQWLIIYIYKKKISRPRVAVMFLAYLGLLKDQQTGLAVWDAVRPNAHEMSLFQCSGSYLIQLIFCIFFKNQTFFVCSQWPCSPVE